MNESLLSQLIADSQRRKLPQLTPRTAELPWIDGKADAVIGTRRAGKTTFMYQVMRELVDGGWSRDRLLYINFEDERLAGMQLDELSEVVDVFYRERPSLRDVECAFFLDEIQNVPGWERFVRRILDTEDVHVCVGGSSAALLSREIATSLRGRSIATEIFPFSFAEYLAHHGIDAPDGSVGTADRSRLEHHFAAYLDRGGFPEVQDENRDDVRLRILQEYVDVALFRDIVERHGVTNVTALRALVRQLLSAPATQFSVSKFHRDLKSRGVKVGKNTIYDFLQYVTDAFLVFTVPIFTLSERVRQVNPAKVYAIDNGLVRAMDPVPRPDIGRALENAVFLNLRRTARSIAYYRTEQGHEVDFLVHSWDGERRLVQVSATIDDESTRQRETRALIEAREETEIDDLTIVTSTTSDTLKVDGVAIQVTPAWRHAL